MRITVCLIAVGLLALMVAVGSLAAQAQPKPVLTDKEARNIVGGSDDIRVFRLKETTDGPTIMTKLQQLFGDNAMVRVRFAYDDRTHSVVATGSETDLGLFAQSMKVLDTPVAGSSRPTSSTSPAPTTGATRPVATKTVGS
jgi:hypothetical protein